MSKEPWSTLGNSGDSEVGDQTLVIRGGRSTLVDVQLDPAQVNTLPALQTETDNHIADVTNPHDTTLQQGYNQSPSIVLNNGNILFTNGTSGVTEAQITDSKGAQFHAPIYYLSNGQSVTLGSNDIDVIYSNGQVTGGTNIINVQLESTAIYAENATFYLWNAGNQILTASSPVGVTINGNNNYSITIADQSLLSFVRTAQNAWQASILVFSPGTGIEISEGGIISSTGVVTDTGVQGSFTSIFSTVSQTNPSSTPTPVVIDPAAFIAVKQVGAQVATTTLSGVVTPIIKNISSGGPRWCNVIFDVSVQPLLLNGQTYTFFVYTNNGSSQFVGRINFPSGGSSVLPISVSATVNLDLNDYAYLQVLSTASLTSPFYALYFSGTLTDTTVTSIPSAGVVSVSGLAGYVGQTSSDSSIDITTGGGNVNYQVQRNIGTYVPVITAVSGVSGSIASQVSSYEADTLNIGDFFTVSTQFTVTCDSSGDLVIVNIPNPPAISAGYTAGNQVWPLFFEIVETVGSPGNTGCGWFNSISSDLVGGNGTILSFETSQLSTTYTVNASWRGQIQ